MSFLFGQQMIQTKPVKPPMTNRQENEKWKALAPHVKKHFKTDLTVKEIAAELAYADYKNSLKKDKK